MLIVLLLLSATSYVTNAAIIEDKVKSCLSALYTAEKAYHYEHKVYSSSLEEIGFNNDFCKIENFSFEVVAENYFYVSIFDKSGKKIGTVDSLKEMTIY